MEQVTELGRELRYTQQIVAAELAAWQDLHDKMGRKAIRDLAKGMLVKERTTLEGMRRALRKLKQPTEEVPAAAGIEINTASIQALESQDMAVNGEADVVPR